jgi:hypothetical protein
MRIYRLLLSSLTILTLLALSGCTPSSDDYVEIKHFPVDNFDGLVSMSDVALDTEISYDGNGSLRVTATEPTTVLLYESGDIDLDNAILIYQAAVRSDTLEGMAYLEMWCDFEQGKTFFSRGLNSPWTGTLDWSKVQTPFLLKEGQNPTNVRLNLVIDGAGTVWIDDIHLFEASLPTQQ